MTSTSFNVGLTDNTRLSSRVLRPPGGGHTDIFGGEPEPQQQTRRGPSAPSGMASIVGPDDSRSVNNAAPAAAQNGQTTPQEPTAAPLPVPEPKETVAKPEPKETVAKPEPKETATKPEPAPVQPAKVDPPKRVRVPPGGFSSGLW